jgi:acyl-CoA thioester hydrolase
MKHAAEWRVRYHETDKMGVVNHISHFRWFEVGRAELLRELKMSMMTLEKAGCYLVLKEAKCEYRAPAWYDDLIKIETGVVELREKGVKFQYVIMRGEVKLAEGYTIHVCTDGAGKVKPFPVRFYKVFQEAMES